MNVGIVSRGYGGRASYPLSVSPATPAAECGDEAAMIARRSGCPVVVDPNRPQAVEKLLSIAEVEVVIADDGLQHYALQRDVEIAVVDGLRGVGNGLCLPAGPLREPLSRLRECHWVVANGASSKLVPNASTMSARATAVVNVASGERVDPGAFVAKYGNRVVGIAGIGNPRRFQATLSSIGLAPELRTFPDHHRFAPGDLDVGDRVAIVTEKDAEKIRTLDGVGPDCWYLEIDVHFAEPVDGLLEDLFKRHGIRTGRTGRADAPQADAPQAAASTSP